jgi:type II secretory pathway pseudopilin PulG
MTLVELLIATGILGVVLLIATTILISSSRLESRTVRRASVQQGARQTVSLMSTELRQAGADPSIPPVGIVGIVAADRRLVHLRADLNGDGAIQTTEPSEDVTYAYDSTARVITRNPGSGPSLMLANVTAMEFSYFDAANQPLVTLPLSAADAARVHSIALTLTCRDRDAQPLTLTTRVTLRNL